MLWGKSVTNTFGKVNDREQQINKHLLSAMVLLEKGMATHSSILAWRILWTVGYSPWGCKVLDTYDWSDLAQDMILLFIPQHSQELLIAYHMLF